MSQSNISRVGHDLPLYWLQKWQPFHIDALGLVTLIGSEEVNASLGRLVRSTYWEHMPLLGAYVFASDKFREQAAGFQFYNVTSGFTTSDMSGWLTRWMMAQDFSKTRSIVKWEITPKQSFKLDAAIALFISVFLNGILVTMTILMADLWGLANALSMILSVLVRWYILKENRDGIDRGVAEAEKGAEKEVTVILILPDSKAVTMYCRESLIVPCFVATPKSKHPYVYGFAKGVGWFAFATHIITIGMSDLVSQLITVVLIVGPTLAILRRYGCDDTRIGTRLKATTMKYDAIQDRRIDLYAYLQLSEEEEESLKKWDLVPHVRKDDPSWWNQYFVKKGLYKERLSKVAAPIVTTNQVPANAP